MPDSPAPAPAAQRAPSAPQVVPAQEASTAGSRRAARRAAHRAGRDSARAARFTRRQHARNVGWNVGSGLLSVVGLLVLYPLAARAAGPEGYGAWVVCSGAAQLLVLADLGLGTGIVRGMARARAAGSGERQVVSLGLSCFLLLAVLLVAVAAVALPAYLGVLDLPAHLRAQQGPLVAATLALLGLGVLGRGATAVLWGANRYDVERRWAVVALLLRAVAVVTCWATGAGLLAVVVSEAVTLVLPGLAALVVAVRWHHPRFVPRAVVGAEGRRLLRYSVVVFVGAFSALLAAQLPLYVVAPALPLVAVTALGGWLRAYQSLRTVFSWVANPVLATVADDTAHGRDRLAATHRRLTGVSVLLGLLAATPLLAAPGPLVTAWLGAAYAPWAPAFALLGVAVLGVAVSVPSSVLTTAGGRPAGTAALHLLWCALVAAGALAARSAESVLLTGAAVAVPLLLLAPCFLAQACRVSRWRPDAAQWWQLLEALAVAGVLGAALREVLARHGGTPALLLALAGYAVAAGGYLVLRTRAWRFRPRAGGASRDR